MMTILRNSLRRGPGFISITNFPNESIRMTLAKRVLPTQPFPIAPRLHSLGRSIFRKRLPQEPVSANIQYGASSTKYLTFAQKSSGTLTHEQVLKLWKPENPE